jgi:hypothetical protein
MACCALGKAADLSCTADGAAAALSCFLPGQKGRQAARLQDEATRACLYL